MMRMEERERERERVEKRGGEHLLLEDASSFFSSSPDCRCFAQLILLKLMMKNSSPQCTSSRRSSAREVSILRALCARGGEEKKTRAREEKNTGALVGCIWIEREREGRTTTQLDRHLFFVPFFFPFHSLSLASSHRNNQPKLPFSPSPSLPLSLSLSLSASRLRPGLRRPARRPDHRQGRPQRQPGRPQV